jgi:HAD superfamily hydrolase (TIGR01549 family)
MMWQHYLHNYMKFKDISIIIWDFDGTLYPPNPDLWHDIRESEYRTIMDHTGWTREQTIKEFEQLHKKEIPSATETVAELCEISPGQATVEFEKYFDRRKYVKKDPQLIRMFEQLSGGRGHYILANGKIEGIRQTLEVLGVSQYLFREIVTSETVGVTKPDPKGFKYILGKTGLDPAKHLMVGDREVVDLEPARKIGMKTCLVWSDKPSKIADIVISKVYDIADIVA